jgi:rhomboid protease GluP
MPSCLKCGAELAVNEEGIAPVLCDRCAGHATSRARRGLNTGTMRDFPATSALLAINLAVYAAELLPGLDVEEWGANIGPLTLSGDYYRLVTAGFVHASLLHIAFNMWCLWSLGRLSERLFGKWQTFLIYLITGVGGALLSIAYRPMHAEVGASGAIFGIAGALLAGLKFGNLSVSAFERRNIISSMVFFIVVNFALGTGAFGFGGNIDNMCHLGGFVTGLLIGLPLGAFAQHHKLYQLVTILVTTVILFFAGRELVQAHATEGQLYRAQLAMRQQDYSAAVPLLEKYIAAKPDDERGLVLLGRAYALNGERDKAIATFEKILKIDPESETAQQALHALRGSNSSNP